jgi:DNA-binding transcriptional ArsR family regulator
LNDYSNDVNERSVAVRSRYGRAVASRRREPTGADAPASGPDTGADPGSGAGPDADGWEPVDGVEPLAEQLEIDDLSLIDELTHPIRSRILRRLKEPRTVAEVASLLDVPVTRLYHHVNRLQELGLVRVVATRRVAAVTERRYQVVTRSFRLAADLFDRTDVHETGIALGSLFDVAKLDLQREIEAGGLRDATRRDAEMVLSLGELHVKHERLIALRERLIELLEEFGGDDEHADDVERVTLFVALFPTSS